MTLREQDSIILDWLLEDAIIVVPIEKYSQSKTFVRELVWAFKITVATMINWHRMFMTSTFHQQLFDAFSLSIASGFYKYQRTKTKLLFTCCAQESFERLKNWFWFFIVDRRVCRTCRNVFDCISGWTIIYCFAIRVSFIFLLSIKVDLSWKKHIFNDCLFVFW